MEGLLRGGKEVHMFGVQKHSVSRTHRSFSWTVKLRWIFTDNGTGFLQGVTSSGWGRTITDIVPVWWEFITEVDGEECLNDFSFRYLRTLFLD